MVNLTFPVGRRKSRVRPEFQAVTGAVGPFHHAVEGVEKGVREHAHHLVAPGAVFLLLLVAMFLHLGMGQQVVQAIDLSLFLLRRQRFAVFLDQPGNIPIFGFDDLLDRAALGVDLVLAIAEGASRLGGMELVPAGVADDFCGSIAGFPFWERAWPDAAAAAPRNRAPASMEAPKGAETDRKCFRNRIALPE